MVFLFQAQQSRVEAFGTNQIRLFRLYPIVVPNPNLTYQMLNARGIDAYMGVTQLDVVESPIGSKYTYPN